MDNIWSWRADHGVDGFGWHRQHLRHRPGRQRRQCHWHGLFVEHYKKYNVIWNGEDGRTVFFQNEMPYDPPNQAAWMEAPGVPGWAALQEVGGYRVTSLPAIRHGQLQLLQPGRGHLRRERVRGPCQPPAGSLHDLLTIFLDPGAGKGGILNVVNGIGGSSTIANPDVPVTVVSYP